MPPNTLKTTKLRQCMAAHAGDKRHKGSDEREEAAEEDGQMAPLIQEVLGLLMRSGVMAFTLPEAIIFLPKKWPIIKLH